MLIIDTNILNGDQWALIGDCHYLTLPLQDARFTKFSILVNYSYTLTRLGV